MSITLYTPGTGFPDLEAKIAYGLARVGIEAFGNENVEVNPMNGYYELIFDGDIKKLNETFNKIAPRVLSSPYIALITPGVTGKSANGMVIEPNETFDLSIYRDIVPKATNKPAELFCRHSTKVKLSNVLGFTAAAATGVLCKRDGPDVTIYQGQPRRPTDPRNICKTCGLLALLGTWFGTFIFSVADKEILVIPTPKGKLNGTKLQQIFSLQHHIRKEWFNYNISQASIPLLILSKIPSFSFLLSDLDLIINVLSRQQAYRVDGIQIISLDYYLHYLEANPFNIALVDFMLKNSAFASLNELNNIIYFRSEESLAKFPRLFVQETSKGDFVNLLYPETSYYLLKEVAMIDPKIIENPALASLARTLRYFIKNRNYGYADDIRNARKESNDFEETIAKLLREGRLRFVQQEPIHLPSEDEMKEVFRLARENFEATKLALTILAFSFPAASSDETEK